MSTPTSQKTWTYDDFASLPDDGNRYEVIDGEVYVTPSPSNRHQHVLLTLSMALRQYVEQYRLGVVLPGVDLLFVTGQYLCPDLLFVPESSLDRLGNRGVETAPGLVVEIQSPGSKSVDRVKKSRRYGDFGVPEYWVVDPVAQEVWVWRFAAGSREGERADAQLTWQPSPDAPPLVIELTELFRPMWPA